MDYRLTLVCDDCQVRVKCALTGRQGDQVPQEALQAMALGWEKIHPGHQNLVLASYLGSPPEGQEC